MTQRRITSGSTFEAMAAYSRAVVDGDWIFVSGTTGFDYATMTIAGRRRGAGRAVPANIAPRCSRPARACADVVRVTYVLPNVVDFAPCWPVLRKHFGEVRPAATMFSAGLIDPRIRIEIEVTARKRAHTEA